MKNNRLFVILCVSLIAASLVYIIYIYCFSNANDRLAKQNSELLIYPSNAMDSLMNALPVSKLEFNNQTVDFGNIYKDTTLVATYVARNSGESDVVIAYVNPDCACTSYKVSKTTISPNDTLSIILTFDTKGKNHEQLIYTTVRANTEDQMYKLLIKANIIR